MTLTVALQRGRLHGSSATIVLRYAAVARWANGLIQRQATYTDIDEARAAAERLAQAGLARDVGGWGERA